MPALNLGAQLDKVLSDTSQAMEKINAKHSRLVETVQELRNENEELKAFQAKIPDLIRDEVRVEMRKFQDRSGTRDLVDADRACVREQDAVHSTSTEPTRATIHNPCERNGQDSRSRKMSAASMDHEKPKRVRGRGGNRVGLAGTNPVHEAARSVTAAESADQVDDEHDSGSLEVETSQDTASPVKHIERAHWRAMWESEGKPPTLDDFIRAQRAGLKSSTTTRPKRKAPAAPEDTEIPALKRITCSTTLRVRNQKLNGSPSDVDTEQRKGRRVQDTDNADQSIKVDPITPIKYGKSADSTTTKDVIFESSPNTTPVDISSLLHAFQPRKGKERRK